MHSRVHARSTNEVQLPRKATEDPARARCRAKGERPGPRRAGSGDARDARGDREAGPGDSLSLRVQRAEVACAN